MNNIITINENNIWQAIRDYRAHTSQDDIFNDFADSFVSKLAEDNFNAKSELRALFSKSPVWNENLQALVINGSRTHNPDLERIENLAFKILNPVMLSLNNNDYDFIVKAIHFFSQPDSISQDNIDAIKYFSPHAYKPNKKKSRIFKALCDSLGVSDDSAGSDFQRLFAQFADELSSKKIDFKLFVSINPAHFLTMSNPKEDERGSTMVSCHSLNSDDSTYSGGCIGYARDNYTFIVFTASDPSIPETLNNRKTSRQIFAYKPNNGVLLQSRMYTTNSGGSYGGVNGDTPDGKLYRDLIQREISDLEHAPNLWLTRDYQNNEFDIHIYRGDGFSGYADWLSYSDCAKISLRKDKIDNYQSFEIGTFGLCIRCADEIDEGLYCDDCSNNHREFCPECEEFCDELFPVRNHRGQVIYVCADCRDSNYRFCDICEEYYPTDDITFTGDEEYVCPDCLNEYYSYCEICNYYFRSEDLSTAFDSNGYEIDVCPNCLHDHFHKCHSCGHHFKSNTDSDTLCHNCLYSQETEVDSCAV